tara:strand:+ start:490 stop:696 length:207 start_codon:yes stop_codon:yes gene_type:complete
MTNRYKQKSVTLRIPTHDKLYDLSKTIVPGEYKSIPATIDLLVNEKVSTPESRRNLGATNDSQTKETK